LWTSTRRIIAADREQRTTGAFRNVIRFKRRC
jgi:hypothetical protein